MLLVVGGTGELGRRVVRHLSSQAEPVRCLVRPGTEAAELRRLGVGIVEGDLQDPSSLRSACQGVDTVVATATAITRRLAGSRRPTITEVDLRGMSALVEAAEAAAVQRFVYVSFAGADAALGTPLERAKIGVEQRLRTSPMRRVVLRPDAFQEVHLAPLGRFDMGRGVVAVIGRGDTRRRWVGVEDVAALVAAVAVEGDPPELIEFGGPEAISRNEAIAVAEAATDRPIKRQRMPRSVARVAMRVLDRPNDALASVFGAGLLQDLFEADWDDSALQQRGITAVSASDFIREQARLLG